MNIKELSPIKRVALGCIVIPIVFIWIIVLLMKCTGGGDEKKEVSNKKEDKVRIKVHENDLIKKQFFSFFPFLPKSDNLLSIVKITYFFK